MQSLVVLTTPSYVIYDDMTPDEANEMLSHAQQRWMDQENMEQLRDAIVQFNKGNLK